MTNFEKIKSLTVDEMIRFLTRFEFGDVDYSLTFCDLCKGQYDCENICLRNWLTKKEADDFDYC